MNLKHCLCILSVFWLPLAADAKPNKSATPVQIRAVLHDPANPAAELFYPEKKGSVVKLEFRPQDLSLPLSMLPVDGSLVLYDKADIDLKNPAASVAACVKLPPNIKQAMVVVSPAPAGSKPAYRMELIDDSAQGFPKGESRVISLVPMETTLDVGEHQLKIPPGVVTRVPAVTKVDEYNMAPTSFRYKEGDSPLTFSERQLQYLDGLRRVFIVHTAPGGSQLSITTIVDTATAVVPKRR